MKFLSVYLDRHLGGSLEALASRRLGERDWGLVTAQQASLAGSIGSATLQGWIPAESVVELGSGQ